MYRLRTTVWEYHPQISYCLSSRGSKLRDQFLGGGRRPELRRQPQRLRCVKRRHEGPSIGWGTEQHRLACCIYAAWRRLRIACRAAVGWQRRVAFRSPEMDCQAGQRAHAVIGWLLKNRAMDSFRDVSSGSPGSGTLSLIRQRGGPVKRK